MDVARPVLRLGFRVVCEGCSWESVVRKLEGSACKRCGRAFGQIERRPAEPVRGCCGKE